MKKYAQYKDSGIGWVGQIPNEWECVPLRFISSIHNGSTPSSSEESYWDGEINWVTTDDLGKLEGRFINETRRTITEKGFQNCNTKIAKKGSIILSTRAPIGHIGILNIDACTNQGCKTIVPQKLDSTFCYYSLIIAKPYLESLGVGSTFKELPTPQLKSLKIPYPNVLEQKHISNYLDHKTSLIDKLISDKQKLIELLNEERTAVINQAVTKGLNSDVPMKDSGIEWLGEIPQHWNLVKLKHVCSIKYGLGQPPKQKEGGLKIIRATNISKGSISETNMVFVDPEDIPWSREPILKEDDIIVVRSGAYTGDSAIIPKEYEGSITGYDIVLSANAIEAKFLAYALLSTYLLDNQLFLERLRAAQPHLNAEEIGGCFLIKPSMDEQQMIIQYIKNEHVRIDYLIKKVKQEIALLKEYKTSLISEAVTGKIDVRDYVPTEVSAIAS